MWCTGRMRYENPEALLGRLRLGREEFCQRLLTMLILGGPYPKWNTHSTPTAEGLAFLDGLHRLSFGDGLGAAEEACVFVDEFDLPRRSDDERGGAPDYAVLTAGQLWLIELKTERASHRHDQVPLYFDLGRHHHGDRSIDITYLTPSMTVAYEPPGPWGRFAHNTWDDTAVVVDQVWGGSTDDEERAVVDRLLATLAELDSVTARSWRESVGYVDATGPAPADAVASAPVQHAPADGEALSAAMRIAEETAADGRQRALEIRPGDLEELQALRLAVRNALRDTPVDSPGRHVMPWLWQPRSGGRPLTAAGAELGYELRFSRYGRPVY